MINKLSQVIPKYVCVVLCLFLLSRESKSLVLRAYLSQNGLHGEIEFSRKNESLINIRTNLKPTLQYPDGVFRWTIHEFPVDYRDLSGNRCSNDNLGKEIIDLTDELGYLIIPGKDQAEFESTNSLTGPKGLWGKSIVLETAERERVICASIVATEQQHEKHAIARFNSPLAGSLIFKWLNASEFNAADGYIIADLYHIKAPNKKLDYTEHGWKLFVTDILDSDKGDRDDNCDVPQAIFNPVTAHGDGISVGDLDNRFGKLQVATDPIIKKTKTLYQHDILNILRRDIDMTQRDLYIVIYDRTRKNEFWACSRLRLVEPKSAKVIIGMDGIRGSIEFTQRSPFDPTWANYTLGASNADYESNLRFVSSILTYSIKELPPKLVDTTNVYQKCNTTGNLYNPTNIDMNNVPPAGLSTQDQYPVGDIFGKNKDRTEYLNHRYLLPGLSNELSGTYWDVFLPLYGIHSIVHRSVVIERREKPAICGTILLYQPNTEYQLQMTSAVVIYRYPIVGRVIFRQPADKPWEDTTIIIESMVHADGANINNTIDHRWSITENAPGRDYYNWSQRCVSAGGLYEPHGVGVDERHPGEYCKTGVEGLCRLGDFTTRHGMLNVAGKKVDSDRLTRRLFTDPIVPLAGKYSIMKRSLVIFDDHGPVARGERLACSIVSGLSRRKAVIRDWFGNGVKVPVDGRLEFTQQSEYDVTNVQVKLDGLEDVKDYRIHEVPVEFDLEFPCEKTSLLDTYNPYNISKATSPPTALGTSDQYVLGDLGDKFGFLDNRHSISTFYNETTLSLFGPYSILGRSMVLHKKLKGRHWACSSIERGYSPSEARELRAIASFHHPGGFLKGYIRASQLIHSDGSASDTVLEVKLSYPGERDRNYTRHHNWEIWVNPVGVDAAVQVTATRCVAAGYRWNPYFTQLADPLNHDLYKQECGADNPLRCDVGDLTARLGTIDIGGDRQMFMDPNFPLEGLVSAVGRSIVVFGPEGTNERLACANIEPDNDIIQFVNIMKPPRFVLGSFLSHVRSVLGAPAWMVSPDARRTRELAAGACLQLLLHFRGPRAHQLQLDFTRLLASGRLDTPTIYTPGFVNPKRKKTTPYRQCGATDPNTDRNKKSFFFSPSSSSKPRISHLVIWISLLSLAILLCKF